MWWPSSLFLALYSSLFAPQHSASCASFPAKQSPCPPTATHRQLYPHSLPALTLLKLPPIRIPHWPIPSNPPMFLHSTCSKLNTAMTCLSVSWRANVHFPLDSPTSVTPFPALLLPQSKPCTSCWVWSCVLYCQAVSVLFSSPPGPDALWLMKPCLLPWISL